MADFGGARLDAFRAEARAWLADNFPPGLAGAQPPGDDPEPREGERDLWRRRMGAKGWGVPTWPAAYGGGGLGAEEADVLAEEMAAIGAYNPIVGLGVIMFGPTLLEYGTHAQKLRHIPPICRGELRWCQGFSEPGSGSDLASLSTRCEDRGDHWLINGQKVWTSGAQHADWCFCLVRTDRTRKHDGISFVLIDMRQPGVEARPIRLINGLSPFCETFFTDARAEKDDLVGPLNGGWAIAKRLLQHERQGISDQGRFSGPYFIPGPPLPELAKQYVGVDETGRLADGDLRARVTEAMMHAHAFRLTAERVERETAAGHGPSAASSALKNAGSKMRQDRGDLTIEFLGHQGLGWEGDGFTADELEIPRVWLRGKAATIAGGTWEVQLNVIAKRILGLPEAKPAGS
ncbi:acyl-CoA dehydrogenase family protein [Phenylobacterium sp.]|uniref:acyl-CoA dehydrogenase family protein n=1 Tax=Phenylobacterium sp. TaxID=1871053 RepID=UPI0035ADC140